MFSLSHGETCGSLIASGYFVYNREVFHKKYSYILNKLGFEERWQEYPDELRIAL
jgi:hypothetical protein